MSRQIDYRSTSTHPAADVYAAMTDPEYLAARMAQLGGPGAAVLDHHVDGTGVRYRLRHGLDAKDLPSIVRSLVPGDLVIERDETWTHPGDGAYDGVADIEIPGTPASADGTMRLRDAAGGSELQMQMSITVKIPFLGGKIEEVIGGQVRDLLASETRFTQQWLQNHQR